MNEAQRVSRDEWSSDRKCRETMVSSDRCGMPIMDSRVSGVHGFHFDLDIRQPVERRTFSGECKHFDSAC